MQPGASGYNTTGDSKNGGAFGLYVYVEKSEMQCGLTYLINSLVTGSVAGIQTIFFAANPVESSAPTPVFTFRCKGTRHSILDLK